MGGPAPAAGRLTLSSDARAAGQGNLGGGNSPPWHGASPAPVRHGGQNNAAALSGHKSKELGGPGFSQLVHDDTPSQERLQLATTQHASQLNLGHLIHQADNHRGSFRGTGFELRTDAYGALRAARGLLLSTYLADWAAPAQDNVAGLALARQFEALARALHEAAQTHQTVGMSGLLGSFKAGASVANASLAPIPAWLAQASGQGSGRRFEQAVSEVQSGNAADGAVSLSGAPVLSAVGRAGLGLVAGQDLAVAAGENVHLACGGDMDAAVGGAARIHAGQAIGILGGAIHPGQDAAGTGVSLIAGAGDLELQSQDGPLQVAAAKDVTVQSAHGAIDWAAVKRIVISTAGGAAVVLENGNVEFIAPGMFTVRAGMRSFVWPARCTYRMPQLPHLPVTSVAVKFDLVLRDVPGPHGVPLPQVDWRIVRARSQSEALGSDECLFSGCSDAQARIALDEAQQQALHEAWNSTPGQLWVLCEGHVHQLTLAVDPQTWTEEQALYQALDARGYSDAYQCADGQDADRFHTRQARRETGANHGQTLLDQLKKGQP